MSMPNGELEKFFEADSDSLVDNLRVLRGQLEVQNQLTRKAEEALQQERRLAQQYLDVAGVIIVALNNEGQIILINKKGCQVLGYQKKELIGRDWFEICLPPAISQEVRILFNRCKTGNLEIPQFYENPVLTKAGQERLIAFHNTLLRDPNAQVTGILCSGEDITERRQAEAALREAEIEARQGLDKLRQALRGTVGALANTVEIKDPYTAGHQRRVAKLSCAIARELGLSPDHVEGMQVLSFLHDIGKIALPAEILSRPGKISAIEFNLIKSHPEVGYGILKDIEFPWPVAQAVLQHHERLDGSGYPAGLTGNAIIREAKILAVADVVEAMASHRPYRPCLGIEAALEEISNHKGLLFDSEAVEACLKLFRKKNFSFL